MNTIGTPKTLTEAITNGMKSGDWLTMDDPAYVATVHSHVRDYVNQRLAVLALSDDPADSRAAELLRKLIFGS